MLPSVRMGGISQLARVFGSVSSGQVIQKGWQFESFRADYFQSGWEVSLSKWVRFRIKLQLVPLGNEQVTHWFGENLQVLYHVSSALMGNISQPGHYYEGKVTIRRVSNGEIVQQIEYGSRVSKVAFSPDGKYLAVIGPYDEGNITGKITFYRIFSEYYSYKRERDVDQYLARNFSVESLWKFNFEWRLRFQNTSTT